MILGRPTTRALSARILVGVGMAMSVGFLAGPARAASARVVPGAVAPGASARVVPGVVVPAASARVVPGAVAPGASARVVPGAAAPGASARVVPGAVVPARASAPRVGRTLAWLRPLPALSTPVTPGSGAADERSSPPGSTPDETTRPGGPAGAEAPAAVPPHEAAPPQVESPPTAVPPATGTPIEGAPPVVSFSDGVVAPPPSPASVPSSRRPRFEAAVGMGGSFDSSGLVKDRTVLAPLFWLQGGIGDGPLGFEVRMQSTQASGRFHQMCNGVSDTPVDRLAIDILFALRPLASDDGQDPRWIARFARSWALNVGASGENGSVAAQSAFRIGVVVGSHVDLPISPAFDTTDLRVRLGVRRMLGGQGEAGTVTVSDTVADVFGGLVVAF